MEEQKQKQGLYCNKGCDYFYRHWLSLSYECLKGKVYIQKGEECLLESDPNNDVQGDILNEDQEISQSVKDSSQRNQKSSLLQRILSSLVSNTEIFKNRPPTG